MGLKTRLDGRSVTNNSIKIKDPDGNVLAEVKLVDQTGITLEITTEGACYVEKPTGWTSQRR